MNPAGAAGWGLASRASAVPQSVLQGSSSLSPGWGARREPGQGLAPHLFPLLSPLAFFSPSDGEIRPYRAAGSGVEGLFSALHGILQ